MRFALVPAVLLASPALAGTNLFILTASSGGQTQSVGADKIIDLVSDAVNNANQFAFLGTTGQSASLSLNYGGVADAIHVDKDASNSSATLSFLNADGTRTTRNFNATGTQTLEDVITDYLKKNGSADLAQFFKAMAARTVIAVSDGNPNSTTARMADYTYTRFGFYADQTKPFVRDDQGVKQRAGGQLRIEAAGDAFTAGDFDGYSATVSSSFDFNFAQSVGLSLGSYVGFNTIGDANIFHLGFGVGVPIRLHLPTDRLAMTWQLTPNFTVAGSASEDVGAGGLVWSFGLTNYLAFDITKQLTISMANQFSQFEGQSLSFGDYEIDPGVSNQMFKNGGRLDWRFADGWTLFAGAYYSNYIDDAAVQSWFSPVAGIGHSSRAGSSIQINYSGDFGSDFTANGLRIGINLAF